MIVHEAAEAPLLSQAVSFLTKGAVGREKILAVVKNQPAVDGAGAFAVAHDVVGDLLVASFGEEVVDMAAVHPVPLRALQTEDPRQVVQLDPVPPVRESPHAVEDGPLPVTGEADVD